MRPRLGTGLKTRTKTKTSALSTKLLNNNDNALVLCGHLELSPLNSAECSSYLFTTVNGYNKEVSYA